MRLRTLALAFVLTATAACAGPRTPVLVGVKEFPTDVLIGTADGNLATLQPSPISTNPIVVVPRRALSSVIPSASPRAAAKSACPKADPLSAPKVEATNRATAPPAPKTYTFRTSGAVTVNGKKDELPSTARRTVQNVARVDANTYTFEVLDELGTLKTLDRFKVIERTSLPDQSGQAGLFLTETVRGDGNDKATTFRWNPPITLARFPITPGDTWDVRSTALDGRVVESFSARVGTTSGDPTQVGSPVTDPKLRVDACGKYLDAWNIQVGVNDATGSPSGRYVSPDTVLTFQDGYAIAPQFGGIVVQDHRVASGTSAGTSVTSDRTSTIDTPPPAPKDGS
jgi:hypothetical protein